MERPKLKLTVIILLAFLNVILLGLVISQNRQAQSYQQEGRDQAMVYLEKHGLTVEAEIPWEGQLLDSKSDPRELLLDPSRELGTDWEIRPMRKPETLVVDLVRGLEELGSAAAVITDIREGYLAGERETRTVLTPVWVIHTEAGTYLLDCVTGELRLQ